MKIGYLGLGKMGKPMAIKLLEKNFEVVAFNRSPAPLEEVVKHNAIKATSPLDVAEKLKVPRIIWIMVTAGRVVDKMIWDEKGIINALDPGDIVIDGGNSHFKESEERATKLREKQIHFLDVGTSGGLEGVEKGLSLMIGGEKKAFDVCEPIFKAISAPDGYAHMGPSGSGHFVKMVHNGIEYAFLQALGEGFSLLDDSKYGLDLASISTVWNNGGVIRSWLLELCGKVFKDKERFETIDSFIDVSGMAEWTVKESVDRKIPLPLISLALSERFNSQNSDEFSHRVVAALRNAFGGHSIKTKP